MAAQKPDKDYVWMIRDKKTGLFSSGKMYPRFTASGKTWDTHPLLLCHLTMMNKYVASRRAGHWGPAEPHPYENCEVVKCKRIIVVEVAIDCMGYGE